ncbi:transposase [Burkholderia sp. Bp8986]|nr:transposase [Burkholderia sp. Bp8986]
MGYHLLTDSEWNLVAHLFPFEESHRRFGNESRNPRDLLNAIIWVFTQREKWINIPKDMPPYKTCYIKYLQWRRCGIIEKVEEKLDIKLTQESSH